MVLNVLINFVSVALAADLLELKHFPQVVYGNQVPRLAHRDLPTP